MFSFMLLILTGILLWWWYSTHVHLKKLLPGPFPLPIIGNLHLLGNLPHRALHKLSQKYGSIMSIRLGSINVVIVSSPDAAKLFLGTHDAIFASRPEIQLSKYLYHGNKGILLSDYGEYWRNIRKFCITELLSPVKINGFAGIRKEEIGLMVEEMRVASIAHQAVNLTKVVGGLVEDMTFRMIFGRKSDQTFGLTQRFRSFSKDVDEMLEALITENEEHTLTGLQQMSFIETLLSVKNKYSDIGDDYLSVTIDRSSTKAILLDMVAAIVGTSKTSIEWVLSAVVKHPRVMKKLQKELANVVGDKRMVEETDLAKLSYLHMVVKETFRLYPVAPLLMPHKSMEDVVIDGYHIPKHTQVFVNVWAFGHDPEVWSENWQEFLPERFLESEIDFRGPDFRLMQFSTGRRGCPAMNLGLLSIYLAVSNLVHCFDWVLPDGVSAIELDMNEKYVTTMARVKPLLAIPTYRMGSLTI
ncbi:cytochrome P450 [Cynara cardunculus var. scolymus]|uniref:Cytochrome P450 n=1 Tax=Cynara cardunculus var. scolymus TaxID=59895 RepID=A0A103Y9E3_CYNCS|nr:cytochrome P450 [Cynara cardunculus var. scolymus]